MTVLLSIFQLRPDKCIICHLSHAGVFNLVLTFIRTKFRVLVAFPVILSAWERQIFGTGNAFQDLAMATIV